MRLFETKEVTKFYSRRAVVDHVSFGVDRGEVVGMLGPNGAGKTTAFRMSIGMIRPAHGQVFFDGKEVTNLPMYKRARAGMSYLAQEPSVFQRMSVQDNLLAILQMQGMRRSERRKRTLRMLEEFGLSHLVGHLAYTLSGGERRRLEIARAVCTDPKLILMDEPFTGIDPIAVGELQDLVVGLKGRGIGILITDHNVQEALRITDRAYILSEGKIVTQGTSEQLLEDPIARQSYLGYRIQHVHIGRENSRTRPASNDRGDEPPLRDALDYAAHSVRPLASDGEIGQEENR